MAMQIFFFVFLPFPSMSSVVATRGRPSWVVGLKCDLFEDTLPEWQAARDKSGRVVGRFYDNFTKRFIATFGWHFNIWDEKDVPFATSDQWQNITDHTGLETAEVVRRKAYAETLQTVSVVTTSTCTY